MESDCVLTLINKVNLFQMYVDFKTRMIQVRSSFKLNVKHNMEKQET
jgi:hypothetical protein